MHKLDIAEDRETALRYGYRYYHGKHCRQCDARLRYTSNGACRDCTHMAKAYYADNAEHLRNQKRVWRAKRKAQQLGADILSSM